MRRLLSLEKHGARRFQGFDRIISRYSVEARFLLRCCGSNLAVLCGNDPSRLDFDWNWFAAAAIRHQAAPQAVAHITELGLTNRHSTIATMVRNCHANLLRNLVHLRELKRIAAAFSNAAIPLIAVKGPVLAVLAYGDPLFRVFADLDILVRERDLEGAATLLGVLDYRSENYDLAAIRSRYFNIVEAEFRHLETSVMVDLHWRLSPFHYAFGPNGDEVFERTIAVDLEDVPIPALSFEDLTIYLCVHASRHGWPSLSQVCDIARLAPHAERCDWRLVNERAMATGALRMLRVGVLLAEGLIGAEFPNEVIAAAHDDHASLTLAHRIAASMFTVHERATADLFKIGLNAIDTRRDRVRYCAVHLLTPTILDRSYCRLPKGLLPLYYVLRPIRIALQYLRSFGRHGIPCRR
ncbi:MAG: nucleotidyltransferase domain-containing protein [Candidatus Binataceae bacterium]